MLDLLGQQRVIVLDFCVELIPIILKLRRLMLISCCLEDPLLLDQNFIEFPLHLLLPAFYVHVSVFHLLHLFYRSRL